MGEKHMCIMFKNPDGTEAKARRPLFRSLKAYAVSRFSRGN